MSSLRGTGRMIMRKMITQSTRTSSHFNCNSLAFQQKSTFPPCTTQFCKDRNIAHTHSTERFYKLQPPKGKGAPGKGAYSLLFTNGSKGKGTGPWKRQRKARKRQRSSEGQSRQRKATYRLRKSTRRHVSLLQTSWTLQRTVFQVCSLNIQDRV